LLSINLEKDGENHLARSCENWGSVTNSKGGMEHHTYNKTKEN